MLPDKYQQEAINYIGNTLLIAGAGTGKTFTIVKKIDYLINKLNYKENEILVISFTNKSVNELKMRINYNIDIYSFHKLAISILNSYHINYSICDELEYIVNEYFYSLKDTNELLKYFKFYDYNKFLKSNKYKEFSKLIINFIKIYKTNDINIEKIKDIYNNNTIIIKYSLIILAIYNNELRSKNALDYDDLIIKATHILNKKTNYKYIFIDEFQDTSIIRFNLINKIRILNNANLFAVGDDFQSIYHFSGADINIFLNFKKLIPNSKIMYLKYTYRFSQELVDISTKFITRNKSQINKDLISNKHLNKPIEIIYYINPFKAFKNIYNKLNKDSLLVLGRNNFDIKKFSKVPINEYLTIHSSKGLESDNVIIVNLVNDTYGIPSKIKNNKVIEELNPSDKDIIYAEERRLFYVALTRCKNKVYLLVPVFKRSEFIKELNLHNFTFLKFNNRY